MSNIQENISQDNGKIEFLRFFCYFLKNNNAYTQFFRNCINLNKGNHFIDSLKNSTISGLGNIMWNSYIWGQTKEGNIFWQNLAVKCEKEWELKLKSIAH